MARSRLHHSLLATMGVLLLAGGEAALAAPQKPAARAESVGAVPFILDAQRILLTVQVETPDGRSRAVLAWFNMGMPAPVLAKPLYRDLGIGDGRPLTIRLGTAVLTAAPATVVDGDGKIDGESEFQHYFAPHPVELVLPAALFRERIVTIDYGRRTLAVAEAGTIRPEGEAVPFALNPETGFAVIKAGIGGGLHSFVLDAGSGYTWVRGEVLERWLAAHPDWHRATGAVGQSNNAMVDFDFEKKGVVARIPALTLGAVTLERIGILGTAPLLGRIGDTLLGNLFWDNWQKAATEPVVGWIGGNVLKQFRVTLDYPARTVFLKRVAPADAHDLDQIPVTLVRRGSRTYVGGLVAPAQRSAEVGEPDLKVGDEILSVDGMPVPGATKQAVLSALHGMPGAVRRVVVDRNGTQVEARAIVAAFD
ncbi:peptide-binding protein [Methylobacterium sp. ID0610]|uniref:peptide-binding protein n=1 Tax=Methylobacterium carpenticola TaxID=3344827 RepID=UPI00369F9856